MRTAFLALLVFCFWPYVARGEPVESARADTEPFPLNCSIPPPDISGWEVISQSRTEFRISDTAVAYLGLAVEYTDYKDPLTDGEFVRIFSRHIPLILEQKDLSDRVILDVATRIYTQKEEQDRLNELGKEADLFLVVRWKTKENSRTGEDNARDGAADVWFLDSNEECLVTQLIDPGDKIGIEFLTENVGNGKPRNVFVGVRYSIEMRPEDTDENLCLDNKNEDEDKNRDQDACKVKKFYHILKVDRRDVLLLTNGRGQ